MADTAQLADGSTILYTRAGEPVSINPPSAFTPIVTGTAGGTFIITEDGSLVPYDPFPFTHKVMSWLFGTGSGAAIPNTGSNGVDVPAAGTRNSGAETAGGWITTDTENQRPGWFERLLTGFGRAVGGGVAGAIGQPLQTATGAVLPILVIVLLAGVAALYLVSTFTRVSVTR